MAKAIVLVSLLTLLGCEELKEIRQRTPEILTIVCKVPSITNPKGFEVVEYKTLKYRPLYRGGWDFTDVGGARVLSTQCHYDSSRGK